jgi:hypothetical protein
MQRRNRRILGDRIDFKSMGCAPINELGVVYLFGVLHEALGLKVESVQAGFPDCIARRPLGKGRWEELRIEFEYKSSNFHQHKHDPEGADMLMCWEHDWHDCPDHIEVVELRSMLREVEKIAEEVKEKRTLSEYQLFSRQGRLAGKSIGEIAKEWRKMKGSAKTPRSGASPQPSGRTSRGGRKKNADGTAKPKRPLSEWQKFCREKTQEGLDFGQVAVLWREMKRKAEKAENADGK